MSLDHPKPEDLREGRDQAARVRERADALVAACLEGIEAGQAHTDLEASLRDYLETLARSLESRDASRLARAQQQLTRTVIGARLGPEVLLGVADQLCALLDDLALARLYVLSVSPPRDPLHAVRSEPSGPDDDGLDADSPRAG